MNKKARAAPVFIGQIDLDDGKILRIELANYTSARKAVFAISETREGESRVLDGFAIDVKHLPQLQMLTLNANVRSKIDDAPR